MGQVGREEKRKRTRAPDISHTRVECSCTGIEQFVFGVVVLCSKYELDIEDTDAASDSQQH